MRGQDPGLFGMTMQQLQGKGTSWSHALWCTIVQSSKGMMKFSRGQRQICKPNIEEPEIHIIALLSSSLEDQAALISDRIECIKELTAQITSKTGITVTDKLFFFTGDKPAAQFECGTQQGGYYKCGSCGCSNKNG